MLGFQELYEQDIKKALQKQFSYANVMQIPYLQKVCLNMGLGKDAVVDSKIVTAAVEELSNIAGQKAIITYATKSVAAFKLRQGMPIGCKVTLRGRNMFEFLERLITYALPTSRDFAGFSKKNFDGENNLSFGIKEHVIFPEINYDRVDKIKGMNISVVNSAGNISESVALLKGFHFPFKDV